MAAPLYGQRKTIAFLCYENTLGQHTQKPKSQPYKNGRMEISAVQSAARLKFPFSSEGKKSIQTQKDSAYLNWACWHRSKGKGKVAINWSHREDPKWLTAPTGSHSDPMVKKWMKWLYLQFHRREVYFFNFFFVLFSWQGLTALCKSNTTQAHLYFLIATFFLFFFDSHIFKREKADEIIWNILQNPMQPNSIISAWNQHEN